MAESPRPRRSAGTWFQSLYVRVLLRLLPHLINVFKHVSPKIRAEVDYLEPGYTFMLSVNGTDLACACRRTASGSFKRVPPAAIASDVEPGSGLASADAQAFTVDYVIAFRSLAYAFACFTGGVTLKAALAQRAFSTRGPNNTGVALTYMFTALLKLFFGWPSRTARRSRSHRPPRAPSAIQPARRSPCKDSNSVAPRKSSVARMRWTSCPTRWPTAA